MSYSHRHNRVITQLPSKDSYCLLNLLCIKSDIHYLLLERILYGVAYVISYATIFTIHFQQLKHSRCASNFKTVVGIK